MRTLAEVPGDLQENVADYLSDLKFFPYPFAKIAPAPVAVRAVREVVDFFSDNTEPDPLIENLKLQRSINPSSRVAVFMNRLLDSTGELDFVHQDGAMVVNSLALASNPDINLGIAAVERTDRQYEDCNGLLRWSRPLSSFAEYENGRLVVRAGQPYTVEQPPIGCIAEIRPYQFHAVPPIPHGIVRLSLVRSYAGVVL